MRYSCQRGASLLTQVVARRNQRIPNCKLLHSALTQEPENSEWQVVALCPDAGTRLQNRPDQLNDASSCRSLKLLEEEVSVLTSFKF
jgi:hypothetical protein